MTTPRAVPLRQRLAQAVWLVALVAALVAVWPARFGGAASFVVVRGDSMEPHYHSGDLVYARSASGFDVGDIAVYRQPAADGTGDSLVIHRLIERLPDDRWLLQGDNRDFPDDVTPTGGDLVARPIVNLGPWPTQVLLRLPLVLSLVVGATVVWMLWPRSDEDDLDDTPPHDDDRGIDRAVASMIGSAGAGAPANPPANRPTPRRAGARRRPSVGSGARS